MTLDVAEALLSCGELRREEIPPIAADLLESGTDTPTVRELAGLTGLELSRAHELLRRVLEEMGRRMPTADEAGRRIARDLASRAAGDSADLRRLAAEGARLAKALDYHADLIPFMTADDEYDSPEVWARANVDRELLQHAKTLLGKTQTSSVDHQHTWSDLRRRKRVFWTVFLLYLPVMVFASLIVGDIGASDQWLVALALSWMASWLLAAEWLSRFNCPSCGEPFFLGRRIVGMRVGNLWANSCRHCRARAPRLAA